jgi:hypothetical protein
MFFTRRAKNIFLILIYIFFCEGIPKGNALWRVWAEPKVLDLSLDDML